MTEDEKTDVDVEVKKPAKDADGVPYCVVHHCRMKQYSGKQRTGYYKCPVPGCEETGKMIKSHTKAVPPLPLACPRCSKDKPVYCERDKRLSSQAMTILRCPRCGWKSNAMARPELVAATRRGKRDVEELGAR